MSRHCWPPCVCMQYPVGILLLHSSPEAMESVSTIASRSSVALSPNSKNNFLFCQSHQRQFSGRGGSLFSCANFSTNNNRCHLTSASTFGFGGGSNKRRENRTWCGSGRAEDDDDVEFERALQMDGTIPTTSGEFVRRVSSRAYDMRRHLEQTINSTSYDVLEANPWREGTKPVYVLTQEENHLYTMKTRRNRSEVERELGLLFSKAGKQRPEIGNNSKQSKTGTKFRMLVEDIREGVLVFEDEQDARLYCDLLQGGVQGCQGIAELEASSVFDICHKMRALAVLFRRGTTPPLPESLKLYLRARKQSLEDHI